MVRSIERVLILANFEKSAVRELASELRPWLEERVRSVTLEPDVRAFTTARLARDPAERASDIPDLVVVLGGDGALLGAVRAFQGEPVLTLGINLGRVGFLASTPTSHWRDTLELVLEGDCDIEERARIQAEWDSAQKKPIRSVALNDVTVQRGSHQGMLRASLFVGDVWVTSFRADGLVVATPSGSTAYSLSAGGPIVDPGVDALVVTPICSQGLSNRPIVLAAEGELRLDVHSASGITTLAIDGQAYYSLRQGDSVRMRRHPVRYPLLAFPELDPYRRLRDRLGWGGAPTPDDVPGEG